MTKGDGFMSISYVFKNLNNLYFPMLLHFFSSVQFSEQFSPLPHLPPFFFSNPPNLVSTNLIRNLKSSLRYELSLAVLFSAGMLCL